MQSVLGWPNILLYALCFPVPCSFTNPYQLHKYYLCNIYEYIMTKLKQKLCINALANDKVLLDLGSAI